MQPLELFCPRPGCNGRGHFDPRWPAKASACPLCGTPLKATSTRPLSTPCPSALDNEAGSPVLGWLDTDPNEERVERFKARWLQGDTPAIDDFLSGMTVDRQALLVELADIDMQERLRAGEPVRVEQYLERYPELGANPNALLALVAAEYQHRAAVNPEVSVAEYVRRFPLLSESLLADFRQPPADPVLTAPGGTATDASLPGELVVPGYEVLGELGRGGMGVVYKALQNGTRRLVALKMIGSGSQAAAEAEAVARFQHPHIVQIYETGQHGSLAFIALELADGGDLAGLLRGNPQPPREAAALLETLARAMHYAHERGVIHRDLKPSNVLLRSKSEPEPASDLGSRISDFEPLVTDFGLAKKLDEEGQTYSGVIKGTPCYMAPEQARGHTRDIGPATDVYALGVILYEMLTGRPPFKGATLSDTLDQVCNQDPIPPSRLQPKVHRDLETICLKCLEKDARKRYQGADDLADDLRRFLNREPIRARPTSAWERLGKWARRKPTAAALLAVSVFAPIVAAAAYVRDQAKELALTRTQLQNERDFQSTVTTAQDWLASAERAVREEQWAEARRAVDAVQAVLETRDDLPGSLGIRERQVREVVQRKQREQERRQEALALRTRFSPHYSTVLLHVIQPVQMYLAESRATIRETAPVALALYGLGGKERGVEDAVVLLQRHRDHLTAEEFKLLLEECYEILLYWAEAEGDQRPGSIQTAAEKKQQAQQALTLLEWAGSLARSHALTARAHLRLTVRFQAQARGEASPAAPVKPVLGESVGPIDGFLTGLECYRAGQYEEAVDCCEEVLRQRNHHFWARYVLALCHIRRGRWPEAKTELSFCAADRPDFVWSRLLRGAATAEVAGRSNDPTQFQSAQADLSWALKQDATPLVQFVALANRGVLFVRQQRWEEAVCDLREAVRINPTGFQAHANLAQALQGARRMDQALASLDRAVQLAPDLPALYTSRARLQLLRKNRPAARADFEQAIAREPKDSKSEQLVSNLVELGQLLHRDGQYRAALVRYDRALELRPAFVLAERFRAETLLALHRSEEAGQALDRYLAATPDAPAAVHQARGLIHLDAGELPEAIERYGRALHLAPRDCEARCCRGWAYLLSGAARLALGDFDVCVKHVPDNPDALVGRGTARLGLGRWQDALADAALAEKTGPLSERLEYNLACLYAGAAVQIAAEGRTRKDSTLTRRAGQYEQKALEHLEWALEKLPPDRRAKFWREQVEKEPALQALRQGAGHARLARHYAGGRQ